MYRSSPLFLAIALSFSSGIAIAATPISNGVNQPEVEVTASRVSETVDQGLASVSIITRAQIERSGAQDLIDLLRLTPGVDFARTGGAGSATSVFLRGTNSNHVLVLVDGVRVASVDTGGYDFGQLPLDAVERVEIVRGPRASYWGSDAIGGVIQIFTRKLDGAHLAAGIGSYGTSEGSAGYGNWNGTEGFSVQVGARHVHGFSAQNALGYSYNPDDDGYQNHNVAARGAIAVGTQTVSASLLSSEGGVDFDQGHSKMRNQSAGISLEGPLAERWQQRLSFGAENDRLETPEFSSLFRTRRESLTWQNDFTLAPSQHLIAGVDFLHEHGVSTDTYANVPQYEGTRDNSAVFGGWRAVYGVIDTEISGRYDHNNEFGDAFTGSVAAGWQLSDAARLVGSFGQGFRGPNLNEQFSPGYGGYYAGNPDLRPERSHSAELGLEYRLDTSNKLSARVFSTRVNGLIDFSGGSTYQAININRAAIDGLELEHAWHADVWSVSNNATWQDPRNQDTATPLLRRPKFKLSSLTERSFGDRASAGIELAWSGKSHDVGNTTLSSYALVNLRASYALTSSWKLTARVENLLDRDYALAYGFNTPGRSGYLDIVWQPH
jgi:vitamin B12 transporter